MTFPNVLSRVLFSRAVEMQSGRRLPEAPLHIHTNKNPTHGAQTFWGSEREGCPLYSLSLG